MTDHLADAKKHMGESLLWTGAPSLRSLQNALAAVIAHLAESQPPAAVAEGKTLDAGSGGPSGMVAPWPPEPVHHTCVNTLATYDGSVPPPCPACNPPSVLAGASIIGQPKGQAAGEASDSLPDVLPPNTRVRVNGAWFRTLGEARRTLYYETTAGERIRAEDVDWRSIESPLSESAGAKCSLTGPHVLGPACHSECVTPEEAFAKGTGRSPELTPKGTP